MKVNEQAKNKTYDAYMNDLLPGKWNCKRTKCEVIVRYVVTEFERIFFFASV